MGTDTILVVYDATLQKYQELKQMVEKGNFYPLQTMVCKTFELKEQGYGFHLYHPSYQKFGFAVEDNSKCTCVYLMAVWVELEPYDGIPLNPCFHISHGIRFKYSDEYVPSKFLQGHEYELMSEYSTSFDFYVQLVAHSNRKITGVYLQRCMQLKDVAEIVLNMLYN